MHQKGHKFGCFEGYDYPSHEASDFYHHYKEDIALFHELGMKIFRTSICWSRIYPNGDDEMPNKEGITYYKDMFQECKKYGMKIFCDNSAL